MLQLNVMLRQVCSLLTKIAHEFLLINFSYPSIPRNLLVLGLSCFFVDMGKIRIDVIEYLFDLFPEASSMLGSRGYTALHSAIQRGCTRTVFKRLLVHNKNALFLENKKNALR